MNEATDSSCRSLFTPETTILWSTPFVAIGSFFDGSLVMLVISFVMICDRVYTRYPTNGEFLPILMLSTKHFDSNSGPAKLKPNTEKM